MLEKFSGLERKYEMSSEELHGSSCCDADRLRGYAQV